MSITSDKTCPQCGKDTIGRANRLITDSCGHSKCRLCLLAEEDCQACMQLKEPASANQEVAAKECTVEQLTPIPNPIAMTKKRGKRVISMPEHIQRLQTDTGAFQYHCKRCGKHFGSKAQQYYHLTCGDNDSKKYRCQHCEKGFVKRSHLNYHMESHAARTYNCEQCKKTFKNQLVLRKHLKIHSSTATKCAKCEKTFRYKQSLLAHEAQHHSNHTLPFKCHVCDNSYSQKSALHQHMLKHSEKKHACPHCDKRFQRNSTLKLHLKKHSKTDSFICMICCRKFSEAAVLLRHAKLHKDAVKYRCTQCDITSVRRDNMLRHIRNIHLRTDFESCVQVTKPNIEGTSFEEEFVLRNDCERVEGSHNNEPKTVANSSVIKCVGNVEPMKIPNYAIDECLEEGIHTKSQIENATSTLTTLQNVELSLNWTTAAAVAQKKVRKKYDPIEMYRKILTSDCESVNEDESSLAAADSHAAHAITLPATFERRATLNTSNFSEMHWRKNFKYTYEYQEY